MAETIARRGGLAVIPQDIPLDVVDSVIKWVKSRHTFFDTPLTLSPQQTVADAVSLLSKRAHGAVVIVENNKPLGIVTEEDCAGVDRFTQLHTVMSKDLLTLKDGADARQAFDFLHDNRRKLAPVVNGKGELTGILTRVGALRSTLYAPAVDSQNRLRIAAAIGINGDVAGKARALLDSGADILVIDTAHGHQKKMFDALKAIKTATVTNAAKAIGAYDMVEKTIARSNRPTKIEGKSFRPAFLFIILKLKNKKELSVFLPTQQRLLIFSLFTGSSRNVCTYKLLLLL